MKAVATTYQATTNDLRRTATSAPALAERNEALEGLQLEEYRGKQEEIKKFERFCREYPKAPLGHKNGLLTRDVELYFEGVKSKLGTKALKTGGSVVFPNVFLLPMSGSKSLELVISGSKSPYFEKELMSPNPVLWMVQLEVKEKQRSTGDH
ncbi:hypothetical protein B9Z55_026036 [Caenorhabditis nigoni]|uniref:Uncharacterized protein n=1 Tax=Caenorhabditis nigoni TaxID=1611254 RepID=A0A2G5T1N5_9PELO|nr:hypothetical protein B9Z55_026036 [Caenorhabditis nigoni]